MAAGPKGEFCIFSSVQKCLPIPPLIQYSPSYSHFPSLYATLGPSPTGSSKALLHSSHRTESAVTPTARYQRPPSTPQALTSLLPRLHVCIQVFCVWFLWALPSFAVPMPLIRAFPGDSTLFSERSTTLTSLFNNLFLHRLLVLNGY